MQISGNIKLFSRLLSLILFLYANIVFSAEPPTEPIIRIESGTHKGSINALSTDSKQRWLVTGASDKTVRVWDITSGLLINTIRLPIGGDSDEGSIESVVVSADGSTIFASGSTGFDWDKTYCIYIVERSSGKVARRISGFPERVTNMALSEDNKFLAIGLAEDKGIRIYRMSDYT